MYPESSKIHLKIPLKNKKLQPKDRKKPYFALFREIATRSGANPTQAKKLRSNLGNERRRRILDTSVRQKSVR